MSVNLLSRVRGSAVFHYKGIDFWTKVKSAVEIDLQSWEVPSDAFGPLDERQGARKLMITFTPLGIWNAAVLPVLYPYASYRNGDFATPVRSITAVNTATGALTSPNHGQLTGTGVRVGTVGSGSALPAGLAINTTYYMGATDGNTIKLYDTEAHALLNDGATGLIPLTSVGAGTIKFVVNSPLILTTEDGLQLPMWNAAVAKMSSLKLTTTDTAIGEMQMAGYTLHGKDWGDAYSLYGPLAFNVPITAAPPDATQIPSVPYTIDWATVLPITALNTGTHALSLPNHGLVVGQAVQVEAESANGVLPTGLAGGTTYYAIVTDANTIQLSDTQAHALAGTNIVAFTDVGTGTIGVIVQTEMVGMQPVGPITIDFPITWKDVESDRNGVDTNQLSKVQGNVKFTPANIALSDLLAIAPSQGAGAARGQSQPSGNMDIYGPNETPFIRLYGAALQTKVPMQFGTEEDRVGELEFKTKRTFRGSNVNPVFYLGVAAPVN